MEAVFFTATEDFCTCCLSDLEKDTSTSPTQNNSCIYCHIIYMINHRRWRRWGHGPPIEQSATLIEQSTTISLKTVDSYFSNVVKKCLKYTLTASKMWNFLGGKPPDHHLCYNFHFSLSIVNVGPYSSFFFPGLDGQPLPPPPAQLAYAGQLLKSRA